MADLKKKVSELDAVNATASSDWHMVVVDVDGTLVSRKISTADMFASISASVISDFGEAVDDRVAGLLQAGTNLNVTYDDPANRLSVGMSDSATLNGGYF